MTATDEWGDLARLAQAAREDYSVPAATNLDADFNAAANPATILRLIEELRRTKSAARTLGRVIEQQGRDVLDATGMHHVIDETGDGDWAAVWEVLADQAVERRALAARLADDEALADEWQRDDAAHLDDFGQNHPVAGIAHDHLRAALSAAPTDTTKET